MMLLTRSLGIFLLVHLSHTTTNSDSQNNQNQGNPLESSDKKVNTQNDIKNPLNDESHFNDKTVNAKLESVSNTDLDIDRNEGEETSTADLNDKSNSEATIQKSGTDKILHVHAEETVDKTTVFEETGEEGDLLVDQMKILSEKIKKNQGLGNNEMAEERNLEYEEEMLLVGVEDQDQETNRFQTLRTNSHGKTVENVPPFKSVEQEQEWPEQLDHQEIKAQEDIATSVDEDKTLTEQIKEQIENMNLAAVVYDNNDFTDEKVDNIYDSSEYFEENTDVPISNTLPPLSDIMPSQTDLNTASSVPNDMTADEILLGSTTSLKDMTQKITHSVEQAEIKATATSDIFSAQSADTQSSSQKFAKNYRVGKKKADKKRLPTDGMETNRLNDNTETRAFDQTEFTDQHETYLHDKELYPTETVRDLQYTATPLDQTQMTDGDTHTSNDLPEGTVLETVTPKQTVILNRRESLEKEEIRSEIEGSTSANIVQSNEETEVPSITQTVSEERNNDDLQPNTDEDQSIEGEPVLSEAERQKLAQAQQYFEQGEELVNNSYKKDYIQAYEYFKLAADLGHSKALEYLGFGHLLGDHISLDPEKALKIFTELSEKGSPRGQLGLGLCYGSGLAVNSSQAKALIYFTFGALGGDPFAQMVLGYRYLSGIGVESKCETALQFYRKVATTVAESTSSGSPVVQRIRLHEQADNKDNGVSLMDADLLQYYEFLADKGDLQAQVVLGQLYYQGGRGVPISHERAHHYFLMAAESGNANALAFLGKMHSEGSPYIKQDNLTAYQYFKKAGDKGNPIGLCGMGIMHFHGRGVDKDYAKALRFFTQSADQGWSDGQLQLGLMHYSGKGVKRDYKQAVRYLNLASQGGHVLAFFHLAQMHASGVGVMRNCHTAVELYKNVAERGSWASMLMEAHQLYKEGNMNEALLKYTFLAELGYEVAQTNVAYLLDQGESTLFTEEETYQRALLQWTRAASQGSTMARLKMGDYHYYGYGTEIDYETAATHYRMATEQQHNAQAMFNLGYMHEQGLGLKQDIHLAKRFYDMAAETSGDAYVPVTLALIKLGLFYGVDVFNKELEGYNDLFKRIDIRFQLGPNWDIYVATFLAIVLGIVVVIRRQR